MAGSSLGRRTRIALALFACIPAWLSLPGSAAAATVQLAKKTAVSYGDGWAGIDYLAAPGEVNRVVLDQVDGMTIRVADTGAVIAPGRGCRALDAHAAQCSVAGMRGYNGLIAANVRAGDMDDTVDSRGPGLSGSGGPGDDTLQSSGAAAGILEGGGGHDTLLGGTNQDTLIDGDTSGAADSDILDGREGGATVSYASRSAAVRVDLSGPGSAGEAGERDVLRNVSGVTGGRAADTLRGDGGINQLDGGPGDDRIAGRGGDDFLSGGGGADRLSADAGDDYVLGGPGGDAVNGGRGGDLLLGGRGSDRLRGGDGDDVLASGASWCGRGIDTASPSSHDYVDAQCERLHFGLAVKRSEYADAKGIAAKPYPSARRGGSMTFRVQCPYLETDGYPDPLELRGTLRIRAAGGRLVAAGRIPAAGRRCVNDDAEDSSELPWVRVTAVVNATGRELLRRGPLRVSVEYSGRNVPPVPWSIRLPR